MLPSSFFHSSTRSYVLHHPHPPYEDSSYNFHPYLASWIPLHTRCAQHAARHNPQTSSVAGIQTPLSRHASPAEIVASKSSISISVCLLVGQANCLLLFRLVNVGLARMRPSSSSNRTFHIDLFYLVLLNQTLIPWDSMALLPLSPRILLLGLFYLVPRSWISVMEGKVWISSIVLGLTRAKTTARMLPPNDGMVTGLFYPVLPSSIFVMEERRMLILPAVLRLARTRAGAGTRARARLLPPSK